MADREQAVTDTTSKATVEQVEEIDLIPDGPQLNPPTAAMLATHAQGTSLGLDLVQIFAKQLQAELVVERELQSLSAAASDWGNWADTWRYMKRPDAQYEQANLTDMATGLLTAPASLRS
jgi:hypothetical protein